MQSLRQNNPPTCGPSSPSPSDVQDINLSKISDENDENLSCQSQGYISNEATVRIPRISDEKEKKLIMDQMNLSYCGCGFLGAYHVGVASCFHQFAPQLSMHKITGTSVGCIVACAHICGDPQLALTTNEIIRLAIKARSRMLGPFHPSFDFNKLLYEALDRGLPEDAHKRTSGRLHISLTRVSDGKNVIINEFSSRSDLMQLMICSCFIPIWSGFEVPQYQGVAYIDGGFSDNLPKLDAHTITVSPFTGESDICPLDRSNFLIQIRLANMSVLMSADNLYKMKCAFLPPSPKMLTLLCRLGYEDAVRFLQKNNKISCIKCSSIDIQMVNVNNGGQLCSTSYYTLNDIDEGDEGEAEIVTIEEELEDEEEAVEDGNQTTIDQICNVELNGYDNSFNLMSYERNINRQKPVTKPKRQSLAASGKRRLSGPLPSVVEFHLQLRDRYSKHHQWLDIKEQRSQLSINENIINCGNSENYDRFMTTPVEKTNISDWQRFAPVDMTQIKSSANKAERKRFNVKNNKKNINSTSTDNSIDSWHELLLKIRNDCNDCQNRRKMADADSFPDHFARVIHDACHQMEQQINGQSLIYIPDLFPRFLFQIPLVGILYKSMSLFVINRLYNILSNFYACKNMKTFPPTDVLNFVFKSIRSQFISKQLQ